MILHGVWWNRWPFSQDRKKKSIKKKERKHQAASSHACGVSLFLHRCAMAVKIKKKKAAVKMRKQKKKKKRWIAKWAGPLVLLPWTAVLATSKGSATVLKQRRCIVTKVGLHCQMLPPVFPESAGVCNSRRKTIESPCTCAQTQWSWTDGKVDINTLSRFISVCLSAVIFPLFVKHAVPVPEGLFTLATANVATNSRSFLHQWDNVV